MVVTANDGKGQNGQVTVCAEAKKGPQILLMTGSKRCAVEGLEHVRPIVLI